MTFLFLSRFYLEKHVSPNSASDCNEAKEKDHTEELKEIASSSGSSTNTTQCSRPTCRDMPPQSRLPSCMVHWVTAPWRTEGEHSPIVSVFALCVCPYRIARLVAQSVSVWALGSISPSSRVPGLLLERLPVLAYQAGKPFRFMLGGGGLP